MAENQSAPVGYGYSDDTVRTNNMKFGLNSNTFLKRMEYIPNGGKDGAQQDALEITFNINGTDKNYRMFPVVKAFGEGGEEITDPTSPEFRETMIDFNARVIHILHCFVEKDYAKAAMSKPDMTFKEYAQLVNSLLPKGFDKKELDIFLQYQWQPSSGKDRTYLEIPKKMKYGNWLCPHKAGKWTEVRKENPDDSDSKALMYVNEKGEEHPFFKSGWFMNHAFAKSQGSTGAPVTSAAAIAMNAPVQPQGEIVAPTNGETASVKAPQPPAVW